MIMMFLLVFNQAQMAAVGGGWQQQKA